MPAMSMAAGPARWQCGAGPRADLYNAACFHPPRSGRVISHEDLPVTGELGHASDSGFLYGFIPYDMFDPIGEIAMPRAVTDSGRIELRLRPEDKAILT